MNFVVPGVAPKATESVYQAMKTRLEGKRKVSLSERRVRSLEYVLDGENCVALVGEEDPRGRGLVTAIFFDTIRPGYLVCTPLRGIVKASPILISESDVRSVVDFGADKGNI